MAPRFSLAAAAALLLALALAVSVEGKKYDRCGLAKALRSHGLPANQLRDWVCLVEAESGRDSRRKSPRNSNGSFDYGLFQINDRYWCKPGRKAGDCNRNCNDFLNDDIADDVACAKIIYKRHGFSAWYGWKNKCKNKPLPNISGC